MNGIYKKIKELEHNLASAKSKIQKLEHYAEIGKATERALEGDFGLFEDLYCSNDGLEYGEVIHDTESLVIWYRKEIGK